MACHSEKTYSTYKAVFVGDVVGEFEFVKRDDFLHPLFTCRWTVRMDVHPFWHFGIGFPRYHPSAVNFSPLNTPRQVLMQYKK